MYCKDYCNCNCIWSRCKANARFNRKLGNSTPCKIVTPENFSSNVCTRDYVVDSNYCANFGANRFTGSFSTSRCSITPLWLFTMRLHVLQRTVGLLLSQLCASVCLSVCLSFCQMHVLWQNGIIVLSVSQHYTKQLTLTMPLSDRLGHVMIRAAVD